MNKILRLKKRLRISEAAQYLSAALLEPVSEADILDLALQGSLLLSIDIYNGSAARRAMYDKANPTSSPDDIAGPIDEDGQQLIEQGPVTHVRGVFELPLFAGVEIYLREIRQRLLGKGDVELISTYGYIISDGNQYFRLYEHFENIPTVPGSMAHYDHLLKKLSPAAECAVLHYKEDRIKLLEHVIGHAHDGCVPRHSMPDNVTLLIELSALDSLLQCKANRHEDGETNPTAGVRKHSTVWLRTLDAASKHWWSNYDPSDPGTAPTNDDVAAWIVKEHKVSTNLASAMAAILRANGIPNGRRPA